MATKLRMSAAVITLLALVGCAATGSSPTQSAALRNPNCLTDTGSHIAGKSTCQSLGRSYSSEDIARTGATSAGDALALLDPSLTVHR
jgi:hypothetical protein